MRRKMPPLQARHIAWIACFTLVFVSTFFPSGTLPSALELDPSWQSVMEYATAHHFQFGTQIVFTYGPLGFLSAPASLGHLVGLRILFAFFWSALVALAATAVAGSLRGWVRYAFLAWLVIFTLSEGLDQTAFFVLAYGAILLLADRPRQRRQAPLWVLAFLILALIKFSFLTAAAGSLGLVLGYRLLKGEKRRGLALALGVPAGFVVLWMRLGQSPLHLGAWFRQGVELETGYSAAMNLVPKAPVLYAALGTLALFVIALLAALVRARRGLLTAAILITLVQYAFLAWKEGFTRSGDWHAYVFLWFLPLCWAFCFLDDLWGAPPARRRWVREATFAAGMALCLAGAHFQIPGFAWRQVAHWPRRAFHNTQMILSVFAGRPTRLYAASRSNPHSGMVLLGHAQDVIGNQSVDVMNYLALAAVINGMNYQPRPVFQGFVAYTPALESLNAEYFHGSGRPRFILLCHEATDGRFPTLEDSAALNYVLNNYVPVGRDGRFLILQQRTGDDLAFRLVHQAGVHFGESVNLRPWGGRPLFLSVAVSLTKRGKAMAGLYQPHPLSMRIAHGPVAESFRFVPSMAEQPFLVSPLLLGNYDVLNLYASYPGREAESVTFECPAGDAFEYGDSLTVRLYTTAAFPQSMQGIPVPRMLADVQDRVFWPAPESVESAEPARVMIFHGTPALLVLAPSKIEIRAPENVSFVTGFLGVPEEAYTESGQAPAVRFSITVQDQAGKDRLALDRTLQPSLRAEDRGRIGFRVPVDGSRDRTVTLTTESASSRGSETSWAAWSQCRFQQ